MIIGSFRCRATCDKCGLSQEVTEIDKAAAVKALRAAGWVLTRRNGQGGEVCRACHDAERVVIARADFAAAMCARRARGKVQP